MHVFMYASMYMLHPLLIPLLPCPRHSPLHAELRPHFCCMPGVAIDWGARRYGRLDPIWILCQRMDGDAYTLVLTLRLAVAVAIRCHLCCAFLEDPVLSMRVCTNCIGRKVGRSFIDEALDKVEVGLVKLLVAEVSVFVFRPMG